MKHTKLLAVLLLGLLPVAFYFGWRKSGEPIPITQPISTQYAYDSNHFQKAVASLINKEDISFERIKAIIIPHHLPASPLIARGVFQLSKKHPGLKTIFVVGPNHANTGSCDVLTTTNTWGTAYGEIVPDKEVISELLKTNQVCDGQSLLSSEHSLATIMPFIKYYYPKASIVPLALKKEINQTTVNTLVNYLDKENFGVIFSIDFSHNQDPLSATEKTSLVKNIVANNSSDDLFQLNNTYLDSPSSLTVFNALGQKNGLDVEILESNESGDFLTGRTPKQTTTYLLAFLGKKQSKQAIKLLVGGDVMLGRSVNTRSIKFSNPGWAAGQLSKKLSSDIFLINLESPFSANCQPKDTGMIFCAPVKNIETLKQLGVTVAGVENNHIYNQGKSGKQFTIDLLNSNSVMPSTEELIVINIRGERIGIISQNFIDKEVNEKSLADYIKASKNKVDFLIFFPHWGNEYQPTPTSFQAKIARMVIDNGANLVVGHHPHWVQTFEVYQSGFIYYSLGNLIFDQMWSQKTKEGLLTEIDISSGKVEKIIEHSILIENYGQPKIVKSAPRSLY